MDHPGPHRPIVTANTDNRIVSVLLGASFLGVLVALGLLSGEIVSTRPKHIFALVFVIIVGLLVMRRPLLGVAFAAASDASVSYISGLTRFPPRVYLSVLVTLLSIGPILRLLRQEQWVRRVFAFCLAFTVLIVLVDTGHAHTDVLRRTLARRVAPILLALCMCAHMRSVRDAKLVLVFLLGASLISALVGIFQYHGSATAWDMRVSLEEYTKYGAFQIDQFGWNDPTKGRVMGLASNPINFSYHMVLAASFLIPMAFSGEMRRRSRWLAAVGSIVVGIATLESLTRSAILALWVILLVVIAPALLQDLRRRGRALAALLALGLTIATIAGGYATLSSNVMSQRARFGSIMQDQTRPALFKAAIRVIASHPLGVGTSRTPEVIARNPTLYTDATNTDVLKTQVSHNYLINAAAFWGILGFLFAGGFFIILLRSGYTLRRKRLLLPEPMRWLPMATFAFVAGYITHSSFHNQGPFFGDVTSWYYIGILIAARTLVKAQLRPVQGE
ncbi:MAG: hypothetical protein CMH54_10340 [Myxococcales bacterium]|nr:hypothetical protein [Myxococcales bacterium]